MYCLYVCMPEYKVLIELFGNIFAQVYSDTKIRLHFSHFKILDPGQAAPLAAPRQIMF